MKMYVCAMVALLFMHARCALNDFAVLERKLKASGKPGSDKWLTTMAKQLGLSASDLEADFGAIDPRVASNSAFRDAMADFQTAAQPSIKMLDDMNAKVNKQLEHASVKRKHKKKVIMRKLAKDKEEQKEDTTNELENPSIDFDNSSHEENLEPGKAKGGKSKPKSIIQKLQDRVNVINQKINHLMFHNHHDLGGVTTHVSADGTSLLPNYEGNSIDTKLKAIDYMSTMNRYNPLLDTMLPYYVDGKGHEEDRKLKNDGKRRVL